MRYDVIIAGAGFTGLALAAKLKNKTVLLIDKFDIGTHNISACGMPVKTVEKVRCEDSIIQVFDEAAIHTKRRETRVPFYDPFCTIEFSKFCELLNQQNHATFLKASAKSVKGHTVITDQGEFDAEIIVDATGWEAVLASSIDKHYVNREKVAFGVETEIDYQDDKLRFYVDHDLIRNGAAWLFPAGQKSRFGIAYYTRQEPSHLIKALNRFVEEGFGLKVGNIHGGGFAYCWEQKPVMEGMFVVGGAAGQTLPLTGEGIRRSIDFGFYVGDLILQILEGKLSKSDAYDRYEKFALSHEKRLKVLLRAQHKLRSLPDWKIDLAARIVGFPLIGKRLWRWYEGA